MILSAIVAMTRGQRVIGRDNKLPWHLPEDLKRFKRLTSGHPIIMGRKTYDSIGRPLPNRRNIVVSRNTSLTIPGVEVVPSIDAALDLFQGTEQEVFVIGGSSLFNESLAKVDRFYITWVERNFEGDIRFPTWDFTRYRVTEDTPSSDAIPCRFTTYERLSPSG